MSEASLSNVCQYDRMPESPGRWKCSQCGEKTHWRASYPKKPPVRGCPAWKKQHRRNDTLAADCIHLGEVTDRIVECGGCGNRRHAIFGCDKHGECLPFAVLREGPRSCVACPDYADHS